MCLFRKCTEDSFLPCGQILSFSRIFKKKIDQSVVLCVFISRASPFWKILPCYEFVLWILNDTGLLHHFYFNLRRLYGWDILWILIFARVSTDWHVSHVFMVHTESSIFVSDVLTFYAHWLVSTSKVITLYIWLPKTEFMPICFCLKFSSVDVNKYYFRCRHMYASGKMCENMTLSL